MQRYSFFKPTENLFYLIHTFNKNLAALENEKINTEQCNDLCNHLEKIKSLIALNPIKVTTTNHLIALEAWMQCHFRLGKIFQGQDKLQEAKKHYFLALSIGCDFPTHFKSKEIIQLNISCYNLLQTIAILEEANMDYIPVLESLVKQKEKANDRKTILKKIQRKQIAYAKDEDHLSMKPGYSFNQR